METNIVHCKLIAQQNEIMGYKVLVFKNLEKNPPFGHQYVMVTVYPRWQGYIPELGENGFLTYTNVVGGEDTYFDRKTETMEKYKYTQVFFEKFVKEQDNSTKDIYI